MGQGWVVVGWGGCTLGQKIFFNVFDSKSVGERGEGHSALEGGQFSFSWNFKIPILMTKTLVYENSYNYYDILILYIWLIR